MRASVLSSIYRQTIYTPTFVAGRTTTTTGTTSAFASVDANLGDFLVVLTGNYTTGRVAVSTITDTAGNLFVKAGNSVFGDANYTLECWYCTDSKQQAGNTITINWAASATAVRCFLGQFTNVAQKRVPFDSQSTIALTVSGTTHTTNATGSLSSLSELVVGYTSLWAGGVSAVTVTDGIDISTDGDYGRGLYKIATSTTGQTLQITTAGANQQAMAVWSFLPKIT